MLHTRKNDVGGEREAENMPKETLQHARAATAEGVRSGRLQVKIAV